jgi:hypothetical protein
MNENLKPGATLPDFELRDDNGTMHRLSELQGERPAGPCERWPASSTGSTRLS